MTRALITGATGSLGRATALRLAEAGWTVTGIGRNAETGRLLEAAGIAFRRIDIGTQPEEVAEACAGQDYVIHCAALSSPWGRYRDFEAANVAGTAHVVAGCLRRGVSRLVHVSTPSVYFDYSDRLNVKETAALPRRPVNAYAATKLIAERIVQEAAGQGLDAIILRPRAIFGPEDGSLFPRLMRVNERRGIPLIGGGQAQLDLTYADNVVDALEAACVAPSSAAGQTFNISNGEPVRLIDLLERLFALLEQPLRTREIPLRTALAAGSLMERAYRIAPFLGAEPPFTRYTVGLLAYSQTLDISAARRTLGYEPRVSIDEGLQRFAAWWRANR
ncbi:Nucleoside-diphosphate-sugar epimerase [Cohnella sp. OV330]|uniref:NAD-dependent epimerase/dehydratase family protein n=1 Tax=Cohnella sp. OV330 TaxID=1855288 RepID=UPI0008F09D08|nr:NAD-dependent epimerase/dehydratase family protein [Cohnella sp. OV330]SFB50441.1 Nucleoside-diphosphate-sugar epimerase [Cohnella sp. OV330]